MVRYLRSCNTTYEKHTHVHTKHGCLKPEACKLWFNFQPGWTRPFHLISLFHSVTLSAAHSFFCPPLLICFATLSLSFTQSLFVSQRLFPLTQVHTFLPHLLSISPLVHFLSPALNSFILSILASFFNFPCLLAEVLSLISLHLPHYLSLLLICQSISLPSSLCFSFFSALFCPPPCLDLLCARHCSVIQPSISSFPPLLILCWVSLVF